MIKPSKGPARSRGRPHNRGRAPTGSSTSCREHCQPAIRGGPALDAITSAVKRRWGDKQRNRDDTASTLQASVAFGNGWWLFSTKRPTANGSNLASELHWPGLAMPLVYPETSFYLGFNGPEKFIVSQANPRDWITTTCTGGNFWKPGRHNQTSTLQPQENISASRRARMALPATFVFESYQSTAPTKTLGIATSLARDKIVSTCTGGQLWKPVRNNQTKLRKSRTPFLLRRAWGSPCPFDLKINKPT